MSILNTWEGERNEAWSAARSSILQGNLIAAPEDGNTRTHNFLTALISIQALVLVKEPYFCEPSYERLKGTEEGSLNRYVLNQVTSHLV